MSRRARSARRPRRSVTTRDLVLEPGPARRRRASRLGCGLSPAPSRSCPAAPRRSRRGRASTSPARPPHRTPHLVAQHVDVADRLTPVGDHHGQVDQHPTPIVNRPPAPPRERRRQRLGQPGPVGQHPRQRRARVRHHARTVGGDPQVPRPRRMHSEGAPFAREPDRFDTVSFPCRKGTFAYLHAGERSCLTIIVAPSRVTCTRCRR